MASERARELLIEANGPRAATRFINLREDHRVITIAHALRAIDRAIAEAAPRTADDLIAIIETWLFADDATHWGEFEKALAAVIRKETDDAE